MIKIDRKMNDETMDSGLAFYVQACQGPFIELTYNILQEASQNYDYPNHVSARGIPVQWTSDIASLKGPEKSVCYIPKSAIKEVNKQ